MSAPITTTKIVKLNHRHEMIKESTMFLSSRISQFNHMVDAFDLSPHNPIRFASEDVTRKYKELTEAIGKLGKELEKTSKEIEVIDEN